MTGHKFMVLYRTRSDSARVWRSDWPSDVFFDITLEELEKVGWALRLLNIELVDAEKKEGEDD